MTKRQAKKIDKALTQIAAKHLDIETLEERKMDSLDFHEVAVWNLKAALRAAYEAGRQPNQKTDRHEIVRADGTTARVSIPKD